jgi:hypothetical protein
VDNLLIVLVVLVIIAIIIWGAYASAKRRKQLLAWAEAHVLSFSEARGNAMESTYPQFTCLHQGSNRYSYNHLTGKWKEHDFLGFDYHYETYSYDSKGRRQTNHHYFSTVILTSPIPLQPLFIRPEGIFDKVTEFFGADDIDFESTEFSKKFFVKAPDKKWAFDVIQQRTMQFLLDSPRFNLQLGYKEIMAYHNSTFSAEQFEQAADVICGILERLPDYVVQQQKGQA